MLNEIHSSMLIFNLKAKKKLLKKLFLRPRKILPTQQFVGELHYNLNEIQFLKLSANNIDLKKYATYPMCICNLYKQNTRVNSKNDMLAILDHSSSNMLLFDPDFKFNLKISCLSGTNNWPIQFPIRIESNGKNFFFILDKQNHNVHVINFKEWSYKKTIQFEQSELKARDICVYNNKLYTLGFEDNKIRVYSLNATYKFCIILNNTNKISRFYVNDDFIAISDDYNQIKVLKLHDQRLIFSIWMEHDCFCIQDSNLIVVNNKGILKFYKLKNNQCEQQLDLKSDIFIEDKLMNFDSSSILYFDRKFVICYPWQKKLCILR